MADQRTASVVVSASRDLIDEIDEVIKRIDENPKGKMMVSVMKTPNADPEVIKQLLQEVFPNQSRNTSRTGSTSSTSALSARQATQTQQTTSSSRTSMTPNSGRGGGGGGPSFQ